VKRSLDDWRDKLITNVPSESVTAFSVTKKKSPIDLMKKDGNWTVANQESFELDQAKVNTVINQAVRIYAMGFEPSETTFPENAIAFSLSLTTSTGTTILDVAQDPEKKDNYFVRKVGEPQIYQVSSSIVDTLDTTTEELKKT
jgi:hypothetical protein